MNWNRALILLLTLSLAFTLGLLYRQKRSLGEPGPDYDSQVARAREVAAHLDSARSQESGHGRSFVEIAARLRPSVVSIFGTGPAGESTGTGVIVDRHGHILTNLHVVAGLRQTVVTLSTHERYPARLIGADPPTDLAVIRIDAGDELLPADLGDSDAVEVGEEVLAIGNAFGFGWTVSHGIVSSVHRSSFKGKGQEDYTDYIQTDAAINPGNSGGPLVDRSGRVVGLNSVIVSESGASAGLGFALPSQDAWFVARELIAHGHVVRGFVGVHGTSLSDFARTFRRSLGVETASGVLVDDVEPGSPADRAGFRRNDVILAVEGLRISDMQSLRSRVARVPIGREVSFAVVREGKEIRLIAVASKKPGPRLE